VGTTKENLVSYHIKVVERPQGTLIGAMSIFTLLRWLGPWTDQTRAPVGIQRVEIETAKQSFPIWIYEPPNPKGALYIVPGLHHEGPADPRLDRFARVLAQAGMIVGVPFLPTSLGLVMKPELCTEAKEGFLVFQERVDRPCGILGISAASIGALSISADPTLQQKITGTMLFGGFSNWKKALLFAAKGGGSLPIDPLNLPVIFLNLWPEMNLSVHEESTLIDSWTRFVHATWEKEEMKPKEKYTAIAHQLAEEVHPNDRLLFLKGTSVLEGGISIVEQALQKTTETYSWLDPVPHLHQLNRPLYLTHGRDDVVVPYQQSYALQEESPVKTPVYITGFYDHTGVTNIWRLIKLIPRIPQEIVHSIQLLRKMIAISRQRMR
jgi:hypothetical protein